MLTPSCLSLMLDTHCDSTSTIFASRVCKSLWRGAFCEPVGYFCCAVHAGINSFFAGLAGSLPNTTFAQNNGVLALTRCASRSAGYSCGVWLLLFGVLAKVPCSYLTCI